MINFNSRVTQRGNALNGRHQPIMRRATDDVERNIAQSSADHIKRELLVVPEHPTGKYRRHIKARKRMGDWEVTDQGSVYGPWLEGVSRRNQTTRFKGYAFFRRASERYRAASGAIAQRVLGQYVRMLNR